MYSRSYYPESGERISIPENYDGTTFSEKENSEFEPNATEVSFMNTKEASIFDKSPRKEESLLEGIGRLPFLSGLFNKGGMLSGLNIKMPKIGTEELLIIATAAFLFFSKGGDRESAVMLLLLLLVN